MDESRQASFPWLGGGETSLIGWLKKKLFTYSFIPTREIIIGHYCLL